MLVSHDKSLLVPLSTVLSLEDMYDLIEIITIDAHNDQILAKRNKDR